MKVGCRNVALATALVGVLAFGATAQAQNKCTSGKAKLAGKKSAALLGCYSKAAGKGLPIDGICVQKAKDKFSAGSLKIDSKQTTAKPETVCPAGPGDEVAVETLVDAHVDQIATQLDDGFPTFTASKCSSGKIKCLGKADAALLGCYSKALGKAPALLIGTAVETFAAGCVQKSKDKLQACYDKLDSKQDPAPGKEATICPQGSGDQGTKQMGLAFVGDVVGLYAEKLNTHRCTGNSRTTCTTNADCTIATGTCEFFFGTNLPLAAGGVATCVVNTFTGGISGTANVNTGTSAGTAGLLSRVYSGPTLSEPCPVCSTDPIPNDGSKGGTCSSGQNSGQTCDASGTHAIFGTTSLDCPPLSGGLLASLPIDLTNTTGTKSKTLSAASPNCRAIGFTGNKCFCDTCDNLAATPCSSNADCSGGICGGKRCVGGGNNGNACTVPGDCPGGACTVPGTATASNQCDDATCSADGGNEGTCAGGPFEQFCGPHDSFRGCLVDADCTFPGDTCSTGKNRDCYTDNGALAASVNATGVVDPPVNHASDPTLASLFCVGPTSSSAVNTAAGLPGLGRLELQGHSFENGDATTCPTRITFNGISPGGVLDTGWTGQGHDSRVISQGLVTVSVTSCAGAAPNCGVCNYTGPIAN